MLPFSKRTTTAVTIFACIFVAQNAQTLTAVVAQVAALQLEYSTLLRLYRQIIHQDVANQASMLDTLISQAATTIGQLNTTIQAIETTMQNAVELADVQVLAANAVQVMANVQFQN